MWNDLQHQELPSITFFSSPSSLPRAKLTLSEIKDIAVGVTKWTDGKLPGSPAVSERPLDKNRRAEQQDRTLSLPIPFCVAYCWLSLTLGMLIFVMQYGLDIL